MQTTTPLDAGRIRGLVRDGQVHRDAYISPAVFDWEMRHLFRNAWVFLGHDSQIPAAGDYYTADIGNTPLIMVRHADGSVRVLHNRCAHKGARLVSAECGNSGKFFRCPYHAWTFKLDGDLLSVPLKQGYADPGFKDCPAGKGLAAVRHVANYHGFIFVRLSEHGPGFEEYFGDALSSIDNLVGRSPEGKVEVAGGVLRYLHDCNWKMFIENLNDAMHPMVAHESSAGTAKTLWADQPVDAPKPMAIELLLPFTEGYAFSDAMGTRVFPNGHSYSGVNASIHGGYSDIPGYEAALVAAHGEEKAHAILADVRHNTVYYPNLTIKCAVQVIRIARPIAVDRTLIESWTFRLKGAPEALLDRSCTYSRLINAPTSVVGHDDLHCYRAIQEGLRADPNPWVNLQRNQEAGEFDTLRQQGSTVVNGTSEMSMRNQFDAWQRYMLADATQAPERALEGAAP